MSKIVWDAVGEHFYETGVDHGVLYQQTNEGAYNDGVAWNGLTSVSESPSGAEASKQYADNRNYLTLYSAEEFGATIEAFTYPEKFEQNDGSLTPVKGVKVGQQSRKSFGLSYRTKVGNDVVGDDYAYKLHLIYGCRASPSERGYSTINDSPEAITFSWEITTTPIEIPNMEPSALIVIDSSQFVSADEKAKLKAFEDILYGTDSEEPRMPLPQEIFTLLGTTVTP